MTEQEKENFNRRLTVLETSLAANTLATAQILAILQASRFGAEAIKWLAAVGTACIAAWAALKGFPR